MIIPELINCHSRHSTEYIIVRKSKNINNSIKRCLGWIGQMYTYCNRHVLRLNRTNAHCTYLYIKLSTDTVKYCWKEQINTLHTCKTAVYRYRHVSRYNRTSIHCTCLYNVHKAVYRYTHVSRLNRTGIHCTYLYIKLSTDTHKCLGWIGQVYTVHTCT